MAWTKEQAEKVAAEQNAALRARGCSHITMEVRFFSEEYGYIVDGKYDMDVIKDPKWGPIQECFHERRRC